MDKPFLIRNSVDGREFELASKEAFDRVYGDDPHWEIVTGPHSRAFQEALARLQAAQEPPATPAPDVEPASAPAPDAAPGAPVV